MHQWQTLKDVRAVLLKAIELEREKGLIKHSLEAHVTVFIDKEKYCISPKSFRFDCTPRTNDRKLPQGVPHRFSGDSSTNAERLASFFR